jgi:putative transposase
MYQSRVALFVHCVWATWDRLPLLTGEIEGRVHRAIGAKVVERGAEVIAIGGIEDHVHLLVRLPATLALTELVRQAKGASAHFVTHELTPGQSVKWQGGYAAFSVSPRHVAEVSDYIARQRDHHANNSPAVRWEAKMLPHPESAEADFAAVRPPAATSVGGPPRPEETAPGSASRSTGDGRPPHSGGTQ